MISKVYVLQIQLFTGSEGKPCLLCQTLDVTAVHQSLVWADSVLPPTFLQRLEGFQVLCKFIPKTPQLLGPLSLHNGDMSVFPEA